jgi:hypothetical protein
VVFDVLFPRGAKLPAKGEEPLRVVRSYRPIHNIGHFRYLECAQLDAHGQPRSEINNWDEIRVAFDPRLRDSSSLIDQPVQRWIPAKEQWIQEEYTCDASGDVRVKIHDTVSKLVNEYRLGRWSRDRKKTKRASG